jgi:uncharacterized coiled-coil protein SlyX
MLDHLKALLGIGLRRRIRDLEQRAAHQDGAQEAFRRVSGVKVR